MTVPLTEDGALGFSRQVLIRRHTDRLAEFFHFANLSRGLAR